LQNKNHRVKVEIGRALQVMD